MRADSDRQCVFFPELFERPLRVAFDEPACTSDGGAVLLKALDEELGVTAALAAAYRDERQRGKILHPWDELLRQRVYGLACGYPDANDVVRTGRDPVHKLLLDRAPLGEEELASQPTVSRFENAPGALDLYRMGRALAELVIDRHARRLKRSAVRRITIDLDPTDDPTHGAQQLSLFNGHYDCWCYLPIAGFLTFDDEREQHLFTAILRPGNAHATAGARGILRWTIRRLRQRFPRARIRVRLDGGFASPQMFNFLEQQGVEYLVGMAKNSVLERRSKRLMGHARRLSRRRQHAVALFGETRYAARSWRKRKRRVIFKAEVVRLGDAAPRDNERFVVTNLPYVPRTVYDIYRDRGEIENRLKELHDGLEIDRTSCSRFLANQFRVLLTAAAYVLFQELRARAAGTAAARAQVGTLRLMLIKIGGRLEQSVRRFVLHLAASHPWRNVVLSVARRCAGFT